MNELLPGTAAPPVAVNAVAERDVGINFGAGEGIENRWVEVDGLRIHYRYSPGSGPAVVLVQGGILDSSTLTWRLALEALPAPYRVYAPDLPGYGRSATPDASYTTAYYVDFLERFLDAVGVTRASLFGSSMSGAVVLGLALRCPARTNALVLSGAYGFQDRLPLHEAAYLACRIPGLDVAVRRLLRQGPAMVRLALPVSVYRSCHITDDLVADAYAGLQHERALSAFFRWMRSETLPHRVRTDFTARLPELKMPVLVLHGVHDWTMPIRFARRAAGLLPRAEFHAFPDCAHLIPRERPDEVNALVIDFLARYAGAAAHVVG